MSKTSKETYATFRALIETVETYFENQKKAIEQFEMIIAKSRKVLKNDENFKATKPFDFMDFDDKKIIKMIKEIAEMLDDDDKDDNKEKKEKN